MSWLKKLIGFGCGDLPSNANVEVAPTPDRLETAPFIAFQPHNEIERLLMDAAINADARATFQQALLKVELYAATPDAPETADVRTVGQGESISLLNVQSPEGKPVAALFTAQERIVEVFGMKAGFVAIRGEVLLSMVASQGAWLNPGFPYSVHWTPDQLNAILGKPVQHTVKKDTRIMLGSPADQPTRLIADLKGALASDNRIVEAWLALAHWPEDGKSTWYLDVRTDVTRDEVQNLLAETFKRTDYAGLPLDMVVNRPNEREGAGIRLFPIQTH
jgi:hypothetical protein